MHLPRLLVFYDEDHDATGTPVGFTLKAWALKLPEGEAVTVAPGSPPSVTLWRSLEDAAIALDAHVDDVNPRLVRAWVREQHEGGSAEGRHAD